MYRQTNRILQMKYEPLVLVSKRTYGTLHTFVHRTVRYLCVIDSDDSRFDKHHKKIDTL